ncbi:MAG: histidine triad nucleotide-binding protein [Candidatus Krumholzibacteriia bacterium]
MGSCLFCGIAAGEIPSTQVYADDEFLAFRDIDPKAPVHVLVIPRRHVAAVRDLGAEDQDLAGRLLLVAARVAAAEGLAERGYRLVVNCGDEGGQTVPHLHLHLLGGRPLRWPPG